MDAVPQWTTQLTSTSRPVETVADYYLSHSDGRVVSAFFLGGVFMHALHCLFSSAWIRGLLSKLRTVVRTCYSPVRSRNVRVDPENPTTLTLSEKGGFMRDSSVDGEESQSLRQYNDHSSLIFVFNLCLFLAAFTLFLTLLGFGRGWETGCTFVVAWGGMSSQMARLLGMLILIIELTVLLELKKRTVWILRGMLVVALVFIFAANATNTGTTGTPIGARNAFCFQQHFLATSLVSSIIRLLMELYLISCVVIVLWSTRRLFDDNISATRPLSRAFSLLVFDLMTIVPDAVPTNIFAQFIPFSIGALGVLAAFNWRRSSKRYSESRIQSIFTFSKPPPAGDPLLVPTPFTLHFPREHRSSHSWCSESEHPAPQSTDETHGGGRARPVSMYTTDGDGQTSYATEEAIVSRGNPAFRRSAHQVSLPPALKETHPYSAPAQLAVFGPAADTSRPNRILASQAEYAAELEREQVRLEEEILRLSEPAIPPRPGYPRGQIVVRGADEISLFTQADKPLFTPATTCFGPEVSRKSSRNTRRITRSTVHPSPAPTQISFLLSPYDSMRSTNRESYDSRMTRGSDQSSAESSSAGGSFKRKGSKGKGKDFLSPTDTLSGKPPWKQISRYSLASMRSRSRDELPTVRESSLDSDKRIPGTVIIGKVPDSGKRRTFGQAATPPRRSSKPSLLSMYTGRSMSPIPPVPALLPTPRGVSPITPFTTEVDSLPVPSLQVLPATPEPAYIAQLSPTARSPAWITRPIRSSIVKGPRPLPSVPLSAGLGRGAGWPGAVPSLGNGEAYLGTGGAQGFLSRSSTGRTRSNSCPSLYSVDDEPELPEHDARSL